jgi:hypothetical protein
LDVRCQRAQDGRLFGTRHEVERVGDDQAVEVRRQRHGAREIRHVLDEVRVREP